MFKEMADDPEAMAGETASALDARYGVEVDYESVERLCEAYEHAGPTLRAHVLQRMIGCVGSLALAAIARGAFARHLLPSFEGTVAVSGADVEATRLEHVRELARYVEQSDPRRFASIVDELASFSQSRVRGLAPL